MSTKVKKIILGVFTLMLAFVLGATLSLREEKKSEATALYVLRGNYVNKYGELYTNSSNGTADYLTAGIYSWSYSGTSYLDKNGYIDFSYVSAYINITEDDSKITYYYRIEKYDNNTIGADAIYKTGTVDGPYSGTLDTQTLQDGYYRATVYIEWETGFIITTTHRHGIQTYFYVDVAGPNVSSASISNSNSNWTNQNVTVTLKGASDYPAGFKKYEYSYDKSTWYSDWSSGYTSASNTQGVWSAERNNTVYFRAVDNQGHTTMLSGSTTIKIDKTNPKLTTSGESTTWTNGNRTITLNGSDTASGVSAYYCNGAWKSSTSTSYSCTFSSTTKTATVGVKDAAGNSVTKTANVYVDKTNPTASNISGGSSSWATSRTVTISSGADANSGLNTNAYCFVTSTSTSAPGTSSCSWQSSASKSYTSTYNGYVHGYIRDVAGNAVHKSYAQIKVDVTKPTASNVSGGGSSWAYSRTLSIASGADSHSGLHSSAYCFYSSSSTSAPGSGSCSWQSGSTKSITTQTNTYYHGYIKDAVGNVTYVSYQQVKVDRTAPTASNISGGGSSWAYSRTLSIASGADSHSGLNTNAYCFYASSSTSAPGTGSCSWQSGSTKSITTQTNTYYHGYIRDAVGNATYVSYQQVKVDRTAPVITSVTVTNTQPNWTTGSVTITVKGATDSHSGMNKYQYSYNNSTWYDYTETKTSVSEQTGTWTAERNDTVYFRAVDAVGNVANIATTTTVKIDFTAPVVSSATITNSNSNWTNKDVTITVKGATDALSGMNKYQFSYDNSTWHDYTAAKTSASEQTGIWSAERNNTLYFRAVDVAGNVAVLSSTTTVKIDKTNPKVDVTTDFSSAYVDLINSKVYVPFTRSDSASGINSTSSTNSGSYSSNKMWFPISSISNKSLTFTYTVKDVAGNSVSKAITVDVTLDYDDTLKTKVKDGMTQTLDTGRTLASQNGGKQVSYVFDSDAATILGNLNAFGINPDTKTVDTKYIFVSKTLSEDLSVYNGLAKPTTLTSLSSGITSPLGQKGNVYLVILFEDMGIYVGSGSIGAANAAALSSTFDTYASAETTYQGAGLGEDGTVVSFSDDANSTMAVTVGASNMIEKRDVYGNLEWEKAITSSGKIELKKVINNEYGILVLGETTSGSVNGTNYPFKGGKDILVIRLDKQGNILFTNVIGTEGNDTVVAGDMNDNRIALLTNSVEATMFTMNIDGTGIKQQNVNENATNISIKGSKVVVIGTTNAETKASFVQLYENDSLVWTRTLSGSKDINFYSLGLDDRNIYVVGQTQATTLNDNMGTTKLIDTYGELDSMLVKYDYEGNIVQVSTIGGEGNDTFNQILVTSNKVIVAGTSSSLDVSASHYLNSNFHVNKLGEIDTLIVTLNKDLIIEDGLNLSYEEGMELQEIGINQYTEQLMILSSEGVHTQRITEDTLKFEVNYEDGILTVKANEEITSAVIYNGTEYIEIGEGLEIAPGAYQVTVTSASGITRTEVVNVDIPLMDLSKVEHSILPMIAMFTSIITLGILTVLVIKKYKKEYVIA